MPGNISKLIDQAVTMSADDFKGLQVGASVEFPSSGTGWQSIIIAAFRTLNGSPRVVVEYTDPGPLFECTQIFTPDQIKPKGAMI